MKLSEILAEIMGEWPSTTRYYAQDCDGAVYPWVTKPHLDEGFWEPESSVGGSVDRNSEARAHFSDLASDWDEVLVTKGDWMRERIRLGKEEAVGRFDDGQRVLYAINNTTKDHVRVENDFFLPDDWEYAEADSEGWIPWHGDTECPLPEGAVFSYRMKDGETVVATTRPLRYRWHHDWERDSDIVAYKPLPESDCEPEHATAWGGEWNPKMYEPIEVRATVGLHWEEGVFLCHHDGGAVVSVSDGCDGFDYSWVYYSNIRPVSSDAKKAKEDMLKLVEGLSLAKEMVERIYSGIREGKVTGVGLTGGKE